MNKKGALILISILLFSALLTGFEKKKIELQHNTREHLIDLDKAIDRAQWGADSGGQAASEASSSKTVSADRVSGNAASGADEAGRSFTVTVSGKTIELDRNDIRDAAALKAKLAAEYKKGDSVHVSDDYADADTYREVLKALKELKETKGIDYSGDYVEK